MINLLLKYAPPAIVWPIGLIPIVYTETFLWARVGDARLVAMTVLLTIALIILLFARRKIATAVFLIPIYYFLSEFNWLGGFSGVAKAGAMRQLELVNVVLFFICGLGFGEKNIIKHGWFLAYSYWRGLFF